MTRYLSSKRTVRIAGVVVVLVALTTWNKSGPVANAAPSVTIALEYTPGSDNAAVWIAQKLGYFHAAGVNVKVVPWSSQTRSDALAVAGKVDFAIAASEDDVLFDFAAGRPITAVMTTAQHDPDEIGVRASSNIKSPKDLDGKTYGGFGSTKEPILLKALIQAAGGKGNVKIVVLGTASYQEVYSGKVDAALFFYYSDAVQAQLAGKPIRYFRFRDYGLPDQYGPVVVANNSFLHSNPKVAAAFVHALAKGYAYEAAHPKAATQILLKSNPGAMSPKFAAASIQSFVHGFLVGPGGKIGTMTLTMWKRRGHFWFQRHQLLDGQGNVLTKDLNYSQFFTNKYLLGNG